MKRRNKPKHRARNRNAKLIVRSAAVGGWDVVAILVARPSSDGKNTRTRLHDLLGKGNEEWLADQLAEHAQLLTISTTKKPQTQSPGVRDERNDDPSIDETSPSKPKQVSGALSPSPPRGESEQATDPPGPGDHAGAEHGSS